MRKWLIVLLLLCSVGGGMLIGRFFPPAPQAAETTKTEMPGKFAADDEKKVKAYTLEYFETFKRDREVGEEQLNSLTQRYMTKQFLANEYPKVEVESKMNALFGYGQLSTLDTAKSMERIGVIDSIEVQGIQSDEVHGTLTVYVQLDGKTVNETHWIEWRKEPNEGWKVQTTDLFWNEQNRLLEPLSPKE